MSISPYLTQYCNLSFEWESMGISIDTANESQKEQIKYLREKATAQSGLTCNELALISRCRNYRIFEQVNVYSYKLKSLVRKFG